MLDKTLAGRYQLVQYLGHGGFGQTFLAHDHFLPGQPLCVVKQFLPMIKDPDSLQVASRLFNTEAAVLHRLGNHPQIPHLYAHFEEQDEFYLVQEYIAGHTLKDELVPGQPLAEADVLAILTDILSVLDFVHSQGVIHRDIKPSNLIRRDSDRKIVVIDFGAVKQVSQASSDATGHTTYTVAIGSQGYVSNEQLAGNPHFSSDIYAVGMVAIQALTGLPPNRITKNIKTGEIEWRSHAQISTPLAKIIDKMVRYDYRQRYATAKDALADLTMLSNLGAGLLTTMKAVPRTTLAPTTLPGSPTKPQNTTTVRKPTTTLKHTTTTHTSSAEPPTLPAPSSQTVLDLLQTQPHNSAPQSQLGTAIAFSLGAVCLMVLSLVVMQSIASLSQREHETEQTQANASSLQSSSNEIQAEGGTMPEETPVESPAASPSVSPVAIASPTVPTPIVPIASPIASPSPQSVSSPAPVATASPNPPLATPVVGAAQVSNPHSDTSLGQSSASSPQLPLSEQQLMGQGEAVYTLNLITTLQQAFYVENGQFARNMQALAAGIPTNTNQFNYQVLSAQPNQTVAIATARQPDLKSYTSAMFMVNGRPIIGLCETASPSTIAPQGVNHNGTTVQCPNGSVALMP